MDNLKKKQEKETQQSVSYLQAYSGPLPTPESLYKYEQVLPGAAERIIAMAEKQADHRMEMMRKRANTTILMVVLSTVSALAVVVIIAYIVYFAIEKGHPTAATSIAVGCMASVAGLFFWSRKNKENQKGKKE